jgi:cathepsin B
MLSAVALFAAAHAAPHGVMRGFVPLEEGYTAEFVAAPDIRQRALPKSFDARQYWPSCVHPVLDQGQCGSCWAFAATGSLSDRYCIRSAGAINSTLSPGDLLSCEKLNLGCTMGSLPEWAWDYLIKHGVLSMECVPYTSGGGDTQQCTHGKCAISALNATRYYAANKTHCGSTLSAKAHVAEIQECLLEGPVDATFNVYKDFYDVAARGDVYEHTTGSYDGIHSVKLIGWGTSENGVDYWWVQNSWGKSWGVLDGFFKIRRGSNECGFESLVYTGEPRL